MSSKINSSNVSAIKKHFKNYEVTHHVGFGGYFGLWSIYGAVNKQNGNEVSMWYLDLKTIEKTWFHKNPIEYKNFITLIRRDPGVPSRLVHSGMLTTIEQLSEDKSGLCYVTEPIVSTLATMFHVFGHNTLSKAKTIIQVETAERNRKNIEEFRKQQEEARQKAMRANGGQVVQYNNNSLNANQFAIDQYQQPSKVDTSAKIPTAPEEFVHMWAHLVDFCERDAVAYGIANLLGGLEFLHDQSLVMANVTPANIAIVQTGEWKLVGNCGICKDAFIYDGGFISNTAPIFRPSLRYLSLDAINRAKIDSSCDLYGLFTTVMTIFGFGVEFPKLTCLNQCRAACPQTAIDLIGEAEKMYGACMLKTSNGKPNDNVITNEIAVFLNTTIRKNWQTFIHGQFNIKVCPSLRDIQGVGRLINELLAGKVQPKQFVEAYNSSVRVAGLNKVISNLDSKKLFGLDGYNPVDITAQLQAQQGTNSATVIDDDLISFLTKMLPTIISSKMLERTTMSHIIWPRITSCLANPTLHGYIISPVIDVGRYIGILHRTITFLLEPLILACTIACKRRAFPGDPQSNMTDNKFYFGTCYVHENNDITYGYRNRNPFQLDYNAQLKVSRGRLITVVPTYDDLLKQPTHNKLTDLQIALLENADFFCDSEASARSHLAVLGLLVSSILSLNPVVVTSALKAVTTAAPYIAHDQWMSSNVKAAKPQPEIGKNIKESFQNMGNAITKAFNTDPSKPQQPSPPTPPPAINQNLTYNNQNYSSNDIRLTNFPREVVFPLDNLIVPAITMVLSKNPDPVILTNCLVCVKLMLDFMIPEQIEPAVPNMIRECMPNVSKYLKACLAMMSLISSGINRFSPKLTATFIFPIVLKTLYHPQIKTSKELEAVQSVAASCWRLVSEAAARKIQSLPVFVAEEENKQETEQQAQPQPLQGQPQQMLQLQAPAQQQQMPAAPQQGWDSFGGKQAAAEQNSWSQTPAQPSSHSASVLPWDQPAVEKTEAQPESHPWEVAEEQHQDVQPQQQEVAQANPWDAPAVQPNESSWGNQTQPAQSSAPWDAAPAQQAQANSWDNATSNQAADPWNAQSHEPAADTWSSNTAPANTDSWSGAQQSNNSWGQQQTASANPWDQQPASNPNDMLEW